MRLSHSKLNTLVKCPATYYLGAIQNIQLKVEPSALGIGSAVHWGIEHNTEDLESYYAESGSLKQRMNYGRDEMLAESMVHGYLKHKDELFNQILTDNETGNKLTLLDEQHELFINGKLKSYKFEDNHTFVGIIDLLLLTDEGFIIVDYKTSSQEPDWDNYLDQLYRYIFLLRGEFPDVPVKKIAIINLRKTGIRQKKDENNDDYLKRLRFEYELNDENYINYHEFLPSALNQSHLNDYIDNLSKEADFAQTIVDSKSWFINYNEAKGIYGKSQYWDIFYETPGCEVLYKIGDRVWNEDEGKFDEWRDCNALDMKTLKYDNIFNKYDIFKNEFSNIFSNDYKKVFGHESEYKKMFSDYVHTKYKVDDNLFNSYWLTCKKENNL